MMLVSRKRIRRAIADTLIEYSVKDVLEIGGGIRPALPLTGVRYTVIDPSSPALARNEYAAIKICASAEDHDYEDEAFDAVVAWNVLEHVGRPERALEPALAAIRPGGFAIIAGPRLNSLQARLTRWTPLWVHRVFYRTVLGKRRAGKDGNSPHPVKHSRGASFVEIITSLARYGFLAELIERRVDHLEKLRRKAPALARAYSAVNSALGLPEDTDFIILARRYRSQWRGWD